ncbi:hypothetical protein [Janthinobacterium sp. NKUCC08_JDC]|uniref:hypothetical protein n=1 Tax=Janthinobacterium sp. NKUCC08_JDC TaxID=2842122 RepID=UPI001C5A856C|nr:hypothetical protein [Janthinobacterium sp. NKUCC08_JDC]MBW3499898.1 hypothetical protein [Janthinobacterium sp. NKUCC08_JDC]
MSRRSYLSLLLLVTDPVIAQPLAASAMGGFGSAVWQILDVLSIVICLVGLGHMCVMFFRVMTGRSSDENLFAAVPIVLSTVFGRGVIGLIFGRLAQQEDIRPSPFSQLIEWVGNHRSGLALGACSIAAAAGVAYMAYRAHDRRTLSRKARRQVREVLNALDIVEHYRMYWVGTCPVHEVAKRLRSSRIETLDATRDQLLELLEHTHNGVPLGDEMLKKFKRFKNDVEKMAIDGADTRVVWPPGAEVVNSSSEGRDGAKLGATLSQDRPNRTGRHGIDCVSRPYTQCGEHVAGGLILAPVGLVPAAATVRQADFTHGHAGCRVSDDSGTVSGRDGLGCGGNEPDSNYQ